MTTHMKRPLLGFDFFFNFFLVHSPSFFQFLSLRFNCRAGQSHKDNVRCTAVDEQPEAKEVQLSQPSSTSLLMISSELT